MKRRKNLEKARKIDERLQTERRRKQEDMCLLWYKGAVNFMASAAAAGIKLLLTDPGLEKTRNALLTIKNYILRRRES